MVPRPATKKWPRVLPGVLLIDSRHEVPHPKGPVVVVTYEDVSQVVHHAHHSNHALTGTTRRRHYLGGVIHA
jgi:hypothetical protein